MSLAGSPPQTAYSGPRPNPDMTQDFSLWKYQVRQALAYLCDLSSGPGFRAALLGLYVESHFAEFVAYQGWRQAGLDKATSQALQELQRQLDAYDEPDTDAAILADPRWWAIRGHGLQVIALLE